MKAINPEITSKEEIIKVCREIASMQGLQALNMRTVAKSSGIALGTLYNYYSDKQELLIAVIGSLWQDIFRLPPEEEREEPLPFTEYVDRLFRHVQEGYTRLPGFRQYQDFFTAHSAAVAESGKGRARDAMEQCFGQIRQSLLSALRQDKNISPGRFSENLTENELVDFVLNNILILLVQNKTCGALTEIIRRIIYQEA